MLVAPHLLGMESCRVFLSLATSHLEFKPAGTVTLHV